MSGTRRRVAIWAADVVGYSASVERDEVGTLASLFALRAQVIEPLVLEHGGRVFKTTGDGVLAEFCHVDEAIRAAIAVQSTVATRPSGDHDLRLRIGVHTGAVAVRGDDLFGDTVNLAARLEGAAPTGGIMISDDARRQLTDDLGHEFVDGGELSLKNISRPIRGWRWPAGVVPAPTGRGGPALLAVLPFAHLSGDVEPDPLADGMVEDLITLLGRFHWFRVISRSSSDAVAREEPDALRAGARLGAGFVVEGSVRRAGDRIRVTARLVDVAAGVPVWSERFERVLDDLFVVQDEIVHGLVAAIVPEFVTAWRGAEPARPTLTSWELSMRAWSAVYRVGTSTPADVAGDFERALETDPENTLAMCGLAFVHANPWYDVRWRRDEEHSMSMARRAIEIDERNAFAWSLLGFVESVRGDLVAAERHLRRAVALNPSLAMAAIWLSVVGGFQGDRASADSWADHARRLSPMDPMLPIVDVSCALARFSDRDLEGAAEYARRSLETSPQNPPSLRLLAASLESMGDHEGAGEAVRTLLDQGPTTIAWLRANLTRFGRDGAFERYLEALARAGIPD